METQPKITFRNLEPSTAIEDHVNRRIAELEKRFDRIVGCDVVIEAEKKKVSGRSFKVRVTVHVPGTEIEATRELGQSSAGDDVNLAVHQAFDAAARQLVERKEKLSGH